MNSFDPMRTARRSVAFLAMVIATTGVHCQQIVSQDKDSPGAVMFYLQARKLVIVDSKTSINSPAGMVRLAVESWGNYNTNDGEWNGPKYKRELPPGRPYWYVGLYGAGGLYQFIPSDKFTVSVTANGQIVGDGKRSVRAFNPRPAMCVGDVETPSIKDCLIAMSGKAQASWQGYVPQEVNGKKGFFDNLDSDERGRSTSLGNTVYSLRTQTDPDSARAEFDAFNAPALQAREEQAGREKNERERFYAEVKKREEMEKANSVRVLRASKPGTTMFCANSSNMGLSKGKPLSGLIVNCDLTGKSYLNVREILDAGWIIGSERRSLIDKVGEDQFLVELSVRKQ